VCGEVGKGFHETYEILPGLEGAQVQEVLATDVVACFSGLDGIGRMDWLE
jgi:hypothetical protein